MTPTSTTPDSWTYVRLTVIDADRHLRPTQICGTELTFAAPPRLTSSQVTIITRNGDWQMSHLADVLPHDINARHIPIKLVDTVAEPHATPQQ